MTVSNEGIQIYSDNTYRCLRCGRVFKVNECTATTAKYCCTYCENQYGPQTDPPHQTSTVDHPKHYGGVENPYEAIKIIEAHNLNFNDGNAIKYILRAGKKDPDTAIEDREKAVWYLMREIQKLRGELPHAAR